MNDIDMEQVRARVEQQVQRQKNFARLSFFATNIIMFVAFALIAWLAFTPEGGWTEANFGAVFMLTMGWLSGIAFHGASLLFDTQWAQRSLREQLFARELAKEQLARFDARDAAKPKRDTYALSDDGELIPTDADVHNEDDAPARQRRA